MKMIVNLKFATLTIIIALLFLLFRGMTAQLSADERLHHFLSTLFLTLFAYFIAISFSEKQHRWRSALILVFGVIIIAIISHIIIYDELFITRILALLTGLLLISITYIYRIKRWFIS